MEIAIERRTVLAGIAAVLAEAVTGLSPARAAEPIRIGDLNSYTAFPAFSVPYRNGWQMALQEINAAGGVRGRKIEVVSYDDGGKPGEAVSRAQELVSKDRVALLMGGFLSNVGLAVSNFAAHNKILYLAVEPLADAITWAKGNRYTFRLRPNTYEQGGMLAAAVARLPAKRWATVAPNYAYGTSAVGDFKEQLSAKRPDVVWVAAQWPALGKIDAGATVEALARAKPDAIYNVLFGNDLAKFVREGETRGLFKDRVVAGLLTGEPEYLDPLKAEAPKGWIVTGYPWDAIKSPAHEKFVKEYEKKFHDHPRLGALAGYIAMLAIADALRKAGATDTETLITAMEGLQVSTPIGAIRFRASDHQSTMGAWVGKIAVKGGHGIMVDWHYEDGAMFLPSAAAVRKMRPAG
jgi:branched-chain amino acid transport system substrate-binding protein